jgi:hypothetical protein
MDIHLDVYFASMLRQAREPFSAPLAPYSFPLLMADRIFFSPTFPVLHICFSKSFPGPKLGIGFGKFLFFRITVLEFDPVVPATVTTAYASIRSVRPKFSRSSIHVYARPQ